MLLIGEYTEFPAWLPADPGSGIALFNSTEGAEPFANTVLSVHNPSFLCADGYGGFYALDEGPQGLLTHFIPDGKSFYFAEQVAFEAQGSCHLCVSPEHKIYISNYDSGTLTVVSDNNGHLEVIQTLYFHGGGPVKSRQSASHIHSCRLSPNGRELFAADLGGDRLYRFDIQKDGRLNKHIEQPYIQLPGGSGPRHMDFHPNSRFMYISAELSNQIFTLCFNENGVACNSVQREHDKKLNNGLPILHMIPPYRDYGRYFCIQAGKGGTIRPGLIKYQAHFLYPKQEVLCTWQMIRT